MNILLAHLIHDNRKQEQIFYLYKIEIDIHEIELIDGVNNNENSIDILLKSIRRGQLIVGGLWKSDILFDVYYEGNIINELGVVLMVILPRMFIYDIMLILDEIITLLIGVPTISIEAETNALVVVVILFLWFILHKLIDGYLLLLLGRTIPSQSMQPRSIRELIYVEEYFDKLIYGKKLIGDISYDKFYGGKESIYVYELIRALGDGYSAFEEEAVFEEYPYELFDNKLIREELSRVGNYYDRYCCCYFRWYYICCYRFWLEFIILFMGYWIMFNLYYDSYFLFKYPCDVLCNTPNTPNGLCYYE